MREFDLIQSIMAANIALPESVIIPPGDDMAALHVDGTTLLAAVDQIIDGRHVDLARIDITCAGRKAITRCLSDVAAMAGRPIAALASAALPADLSAERAEQLARAMRETAASFDCPLIGGDLAIHADAAHPLLCSVTVLALPGPIAPVTRGGATAGEALYVTGELGGSLDADGGGHHLTFTPRIEAGLALAESLGDRLSAMIDLSDGLGRDAGHIAEMSGVDLEIEAERLPCRTGCDTTAALGDGEDYELLFTAMGPVPATLPSGNGGTIPVTRIGTVLAPEGTPTVRLRVGDRLRDVSDLGFEHRSQA